jgi:GrpB-like predicted nucleotidyltransferase (UPF0157 family)
MTGSEREPESKASIGLRQGYVRLVPYDPGWLELFEEEKARICASLDEPSLDVQHVGSTAVPGIDAKPIIDMAIGVDDPKGAEAVIRAALESIGWELRHEAVLTGNRLFFVKGQPRTHHLHVVERDSDVWTDMLLFRDFLLDHPEVAAQYLSFKRQLAERFAAKRESYTRGKGPFIESALEVARGEKPLDELTTDIPELPT